LSPVTATGVLLALEGIDGSGKSTQAHLLAKALSHRGANVVLTREPTAGPAGIRLRHYLAGPTRYLSPAAELGLFMDDRRDHVTTVILPALATGQVVITDRYYYSSVAYQGALGLDPAGILDDNEAFAPRPGLAFFLTLPPALALTRLSTHPGRQRQLTEYQNYLELVAAIYGSLTGPHIYRVDAANLPEIVHADILTITLDYLDQWQNCGKPGSTL
jgi:dTMP kinase